MKNYKKIVPNILTASRLILTPVIIILGILGQYKLVILLATICALTDMFDGKLARKWNTISDFGAKLDTIADKAFAIGLVACLAKKIKILNIPLILEFIIAIFNLYYYYKKTHETHSLMIGKIKTTSFFIAIIISMFSVFYKNTLFLANGFIYSTINLQILCIFAYYEYYINYNNQTKNIDDLELEKTKKINDLNELIDTYEKEV